MKETDNIIRLEEGDYEVTPSGEIRLKVGILSSQKILQKPIKEGEKWVKHVRCDGARFHVLSFSSKTSCSEPNCIVNKLGTVPVQ